MNRNAGSWLLLAAALAGVTTGCQSDPTPSVDDCGSPLLRAIYSGGDREIQRIINSGRGLHFKGCKEEKTPLVVAIGQRMPQVAKALVLGGADPNIATRDGTTPLIAASFGCYEEVVSALLDHGASVNDVSREGASALMNASGGTVMCREGKVVGLLLKAGAKLELRDVHGQTALTIASFYGNESAVRQLVAAGADLNAALPDGETALSIARDRKVGRLASHDRVYAFLLGESKKNSSRGPCH